MKVECVKLNLKDALLTAERFTGKQLSLPVLRYVLFIACEKMLKIRATNLDLGIEIEIPARIEKEGVIAIPADTLGNFLSNLPNEKNVTIEQVGEHLTITGASYSTLIKGFGYEDFPTLPFITKGTELEIDIKSLLGAFRATSYAVATSDVKPEFASIYCYTDVQSLVMVASDSSRLAEKRIPLKSPCEQLSLLIPGKNVVEIIRALENIDGVVKIIATKNQISFHTEHMHITSRLVDGMFPDYRQIIPKQFLTEAIMLRQDVIDRLKLTTVFSGKLQQVRLKIYPSEKFVEIESRNDDIGETTHQIDAALKGDDVEFLLNQRFLMDVFSYLNTDSISLSASGNARALVVKGVGDNSFQYLVMPMKG
ncbi:MAG: DNA polymerase III subunit beta [Candidatus Lloydbacteria bacterium RIFCSPHIGHO2_01_FULL_49_22]|uniref:Beta sliding clamp n=1 Tax=Candidatus Lloydbacteria bacterium RIFCSPHIGHO2_01_FULL_49_22 TaxID=1798658 RepID=A0A1G2CYN1_9BACT|nr:MAG: DNA polymerase III subunit beta [Candidatus Lloydbacteria bacterium RIFCSPHIGHO2_01_FULL_49_22]OGZ09832.1 MAG: DNA polymerase III subunit beta [Candidatus Lloydbacteria bacterium RIFCSPHIGHO2_02_FULL_50_18]